MPEAGPDDDARAALLHALFDQSVLASAEEEDLSQARRVQITPLGEEVIQVGHMLNGAKALLAESWAGRPEEMTALGLLAHLHSRGWRHVMVAPRSEVESFSPSKQNCVLYTAFSEKRFKQSYLLRLVLGKATAHLKSERFYLEEASEREPRPARSAHRGAQFVTADEDDWDAGEHRALELEISASLGGHNVCVCVLCTL